MAAIRNKLVQAVITRTYALTDYNVHNDLDKRYEFRKQTVVTDKFLTKDEKSEAMKLLIGHYDYNKILYNEGTKRICENCHEECLATLYCEHCIRNYLKALFSILRCIN